MPLVASFQIGTVLIVVVLIALPVGAIVFATGAGGALKEIGKGPLAIEQDFPQSSGGPMHAVSTEVREEEIRQMIQARSDRGIAKGREPLDVDAEVERLLASESSGSGLAGDREIREEVRQLVVARNERRKRQGKEPLDETKEIERQLRELENLGQ
jgi:phosphoglycolate phosphatase-like HAD superfamily hydrolase